MDMLQLVKKIKIVAISDTHNRYKDLIIPECDILISAGDYSSMGYEHEVRNFHQWLNKQKATHIISVQGNHEMGVEANFHLMKQIALEACPRGHFIDEGPLEIEGINFWCSAITPFFCDWAWNRHRGEDIQGHWDKIDPKTNILVTHGPPHGILDQTSYADGTLKEGHLGCYQLMQKVKEIKPDIHIFGHIHTQGGQEMHVDGTSFYNAAICDEFYLPTNTITIIEYEKKL